MPDRGSYLRQIPVNFRVPQGSILGPVMFTVYVNSKDLGVYVDQTLSYSKHVSKLFSSCAHKLVQRSKNLTLLYLLNFFTIRQFKVTNKNHV